jgi:hypothetical protein
MRYRPTAYELWAFAVGVISDVLLIRNGLSYGGPTLLDKYPAIWPVWLTVIFLCSLLLSLRRSHERHADPNTTGTAREPVGSAGLRIPLAILLGAFVAHTALLIRDVIADPTSHSVLPIEYLFWGTALAVPSFLGWGLAQMIFRLRNRAKPE